MTICIVDTSIVVELLDVPGVAANHDDLVATYSERAKARQHFLLPVPVILEVGNHVARVRDGRLRRTTAERFIDFAMKALDGNSPFVATPAPRADEIRAWLPGFEEDAMRGVNLVDRTLIQLYEDQQRIHPRRRIYIWSLDEPLMAYDTGER